MILAIYALATSQLVILVVLWQLFRLLRQAIRTEVSFITAKMNGTAIVNYAEHEYKPKMEVETTRG
jgi:hypothetical protein